MKATDGGHERRRDTPTMTAWQARRRRGRASMDRLMSALFALILAAFGAYVFGLGRLVAPVLGPEPGGAAQSPAAARMGPNDPLNPALLMEGGRFRTGSDDWDTEVPYGSPYSKADESPHWRTVPAFWIQQHEVTNEEYERFDSAHSFTSGTERLPVVNVTLRQAMAYAEHVGGSLPTEAQWEFAARGTSRRVYPWGEEEPTCERAHFGDCEPSQLVDVMTRPAGATPEGVHDLAGNAWEWVIPVWFDRTRHPVNHETRRLKGGSYVHPAFFLRAAAVTRSFPTNYRWRNIGFRVVWPYE